MRRGFDPWVGKIPWSRKWQPAPIFLAGKFHGQRSLVGYSPWGRKELDMTERTHARTQTHTHTHTHRSTTKQNAIKWGMPIYKYLQTTAAAPTTKLHIFCSQWEKIKLNNHIQRWILGILKAYKEYFQKDNRRKFRKSLWLGIGNDF